MSKLTILKEYVTQKYFRKFETKEQVRSFQDKQIKKHLSFVLRHSSFYRKYYKDYMKNGVISDWKQLPTIDKNMMMEHFDTLNTVGIDKETALKLAFQAEEDRNFSPTLNGITIGLSSGTSGNRGIFIVSPHERFRWAGVILAKLLPGSIFRTHRIAFFLRANSNLYTSTESKNIQFHFFDLMDEIQEHILKLNDFKPTVLVAPPSMLRFLADAKLDERLKVAPDKVISVAEVLEKEDEEIISTAFQQKVHQVYQCTEGFLATTCPSGTLHINEDIIAMQKEFIDEENKRFMPIITDFSRTSQPILRYRLNDILQEKVEKCPCGSPFLAIEKIEGRTDDIFYLQDVNKKGLKPVFPDFLRRAVMEGSENILAYRLIQETPEQILAEIKWRTGLNEEEPVADSIKRMCLNLTVVAPQIQFRPYHFQPGGTKLRRIERSPFPIE